MQKTRKLVVGALIILAASASVLFAIERETKPTLTHVRTLRVTDEGNHVVSENAGQIWDEQSVRLSGSKPSMSEAGSSLTTNMPKAIPKKPLSPEHQAAHRAEERVFARKEFGALFQNLGLSPHQEDDFLDVIVADRVAEPSIAELRANRHKRAREQAEKIGAIIGYDNVPVYEEYLRNLAEHTRASQIAMQLDVAGVPLSKEQKAYLVNLLIAERDRVAQPSTLKAIATTSDIERELDWMEDQDRRVHEGAASALSPKQLKYLDEVLAARMARRRVDLYMIPVISEQ